MSYSRWSSSRWYTYYVVRDTCERGEQCFDVCSVRCFRYKELKEDLEKCLDEAIKKENEGTTKPVTEKEREELKEYMLLFIEDVEHDKEVNEYMMVKEASENELPLLLHVKGEASNLLEERLKKI